MKDIRVGAWYERKYVLGPGDERFTPEVVGLSIEATYENAEEARQAIVEELAWLKAQVTAEVEAAQQKARRKDDSGMSWVSTMPPSSANVDATFTPVPPMEEPIGDAHDPAEVPDAEVWCGNCKGTLVSDLSLKDIEFYLGSNIVTRAPKDDVRVNDFVTALEFWRKQKGGT